MSELVRTHSEGEDTASEKTNPYKHSFLGTIWDTFDHPPEERKLLVKLDAVLLVFASVGYFLKNIDQSNVSSAFVSGMKEDLDMVQNQLTTAITWWTVGYVIGQIPSNLLLTRISPRYWIPVLEIGWGVMTLATYRVSNYQALYALRFLVGLFESGFYPGMQYILGGFYKPTELAKRAVLFHTAGGIGTLFSSFLQAAAYTNLSGVNGLSGWRWSVLNLLSQQSVVQLQQSSLEAVVQVQQVPCSTLAGSVVEIEPRRRRRLAASKPVGQLCAH